MNSGTGIQELMAAETRASQIVAEARIGMFSCDSRALPCPPSDLDIKIEIPILCFCRIGDNICALCNVFLHLHVH